jgi:hypothetical protein
MLKLDTSRRFLATLLALALFLGGASQTFASISMAQCAAMSMTDSMSMSNMQDDGAGTPHHGMPCTDSGTDCVWVAGCMTVFTAPLPERFAFPLAHRDDGVEISTISGSSRSIPPPLPPPISFV